MLRSALYHSFSSESCFLCAGKLTDKNRTQEHIIPRWVQHEFQLENQFLTLLNRTEIPYRLLTVPCCAKCNNEELARRESRVQRAILKGFDATKKLPRFLLVQWVGKIVIGLLYKELHLLRDRKDPSKGKIATRRMIKEYQSLFVWLQLALGKGKLRGFCPASVFVFKTQAAPLTRNSFDMFDSFRSRTFAIRMGTVGIVVDFLENGFHYANYGRQYNRYRKVALHPLQFRELATKIFYGASLINMRWEMHFGVSLKGGETHFFCKPVGEPSVEPWNQSDYAAFLSFYTGFPKEELSPDGTLLHGPIGSEPPKSAALFVR
jgi:hypothetical protein